MRFGLQKQKDDTKKLSWAILKKMEEQKRIRIKYTSRLGSFIKGLLPRNRRFSLYLCHTHTHSFQKTRMLTHTGVQ